MNLVNEHHKLTFSKFSVKSFLTKPLSDHLSDQTAHFATIWPLKFTVTWSLLFTVNCWILLWARNSSWYLFTFSKQIQRTSSVCPSVIGLKQWHQKPSQREATCYYWLKPSKFWEESIIKRIFLMTLVTKWPLGGAQHVSGVYRHDRSQHPGHFPWQPTKADCISLSSKAALMQYRIHTEYCMLLVQSARTPCTSLSRGNLRFLHERKNFFLAHRTGLETFSPFCQKLTLKSKSKQRRKALTKNWEFMTLIFR